MKISEQTKRDVNQCREILHNVLMREKDNHQPADSEVDELRYTVFLLEMGEAVDHVAALCATADMSDEDVTNSCDHAGVTVHGALRNAKMNMMGQALNVLTKMFAPPSKE